MALINKKEVNQAALRVLKGNRAKLTRQQYKTLRGQILAGDDIGAMRGMLKLLNEKETPTT